MLNIIRAIRWIQNRPMYFRIFFHDVRYRISMRFIPREERHARMRVRIQQFTSNPQVPYELKKLILEAEKVITDGDSESTAAAIDILKAAKKEIEGTL